MDKKNKNIKVVTDLIKEVTEKPAGIIAVPTQLIHFVGNVTYAVFLSQLLYWSDKGKRADGFIFKTAKEWEIETGLSEYQVGKASDKLVEFGVLQTKVKKANGSPTTHYKLDIEKLCVLLRQFLDNGNEENLGIKKDVTGVSLTDTTSKNTQDTSSRESELSIDNQNSLIKKETNQSYNENQNPSAVMEENSSLFILDNVQASIDENTRIRIPDDFQPSLNVRFQAANLFPKKSPHHVTKKFVNHFREKGNRKTLDEWQDEWWNWMNTERPSVGKYLFDDENNDVNTEVFNLFLDAYYQIESYVVDVSELRGHVGDILSEESFDDGIRKWFTRHDDYVHLTQICNDYEEFWYVIDDLLALGINESHDGHINFLLKQKLAEIHTGRPTL